MVKTAKSVPFITLSLRPELSTPLHKQLYDQLREAILTGRLLPGMRLPSSRILVQELAVSRNTINNALDQLRAEGYIESRIGDGTYVTRLLPEELLRSPSEAQHSWTISSGSRQISQRGQVLGNTPVGINWQGSNPRPFRSGAPDVGQFPLKLWLQLYQRIERSIPARLLRYGEPAGFQPLREAIATYLQTARALRCDPQQVIITSGSQQALDLAARVLLDPGDSAWVEDPGYKGARGALIGAGARIVPVPLDIEGLDVTVGIRQDPQARLVFVTPSYQHPLGITMSLPRRLALLEWANRVGAWILEDDYDSEYRYASRPISSLQGLDVNNRVIYVGTFSKVMFPALRLGYLVVPPDLVDVFVSARALTDRHSPILEQAVLTAFIVEGHYNRHIRRMRTIYAARQTALVEAAHKYLAGLLEVRQAEAGMHLIGWLPNHFNDELASTQALNYGVEAAPLSAYCVRPFPRNGLHLGYAGFEEHEIREGVQRLAMALEAVEKSSRVPDINREEHCAEA